MTPEGLSPVLDRDQPVALVGIACRFAGGIVDPGSFWEALLAGQDSLGYVPEDRWNSERFHSNAPERSDRIVTRRGGFLTHPANFDAEFFGISPREAEAMDPQQRQLLEVVYEAIEDACIHPDLSAGQDVGVFVGASGHDYSDLQQKSSAAGMYTNTGGAVSMLANRVSYQFDFRGPSFVVDTACSSSAAAVHLASEALKRGECSAAIAAGVSLIFNPNLSIGFSRAGMLSPDGLSRPFDAAANGYVRSEGVGAILLMPAAAARERAARVYALVAGSAMNQDGSTPVITHPSEDAQARLVSGLYHSLGVRPEQIAYVEAHGAGTPVGDRIEARALGTALGCARSADAPLRIGSVKGNIGHTEAASGIAAIIKVALCLHHRRWVRSINYSAAPADLPLDRMNLRVQAAAERWRPDEERRIAGVNSFGFGGTNVHIALMEAAPAPAAVNVSSNEVRRLPVPITAATEPALGRMMKRLEHHIRSNPKLELEDLSYTACLRRRHHPAREVIFADSTQDLQRQLQKRVQQLPAAKRERPTPAKPHPLISTRRLIPIDEAPRESEPAGGNGTARRSISRAPAAFVFAGQGGHWNGIARRQLRIDHVFRDAVREIDTLFRPIAGWSLLDFLEDPASVGPVSETRYAQPAAFAIQVALARSWESSGVRPDIVVGHSAGEVAAAFVAGVYRLSDAVDIIYHRSRLQNQTSGRGRMLAVAGNEASIHEKLARPEWNGLVVAARNGPALWTLAGDGSALESLSSSLTAAGVFNRVLDIGYAFHSPFMDPIRNEVKRALAAIQPAGSRVRLYSTVTGAELPGERWDADYWWNNIRQPVLFYEAVHQIRKDAGGDVIWIEMGPAVFERSLREVTGPGGPNRYIASLADSGFGHDFEIAVRQAFQCSLPVQWSRFISNGKPVPLPAYPWEPSRYWDEPAASERHRLSPVRHPWVSSVGMVDTEWVAVLSAATLPELKDHVVAGSAVFAAAAYLDMALALPVAGSQGPRYIEHVEFLKSLTVPSRKPLLLRLNYETDTQRFSFSSTEAEQTHARLHCQGRLRPVPKLTPPPAIDVATTLARFFTHLNSWQVYKRFSRASLNYGPRFQGVRDAWVGEQETFAAICVEAVTDEQRLDHPFHPGYLDACFQACFVSTRPETELTALPVALRSLEIFRQPTRNCWVHATSIRETTSELQANFSVYDQDGEPVARGHALRARKFEGSVVKAARNPLYEEQWRSQEAEPSIAGKAKLLCFGASSLRNAVAVVETAHTRFVDLDNPECLEQALADLAAARPDFDQCLFVADCAADDPAGIGAFSHCTALLRIARALGTASLPTGFRLRIVTRTACAVDSSDCPNPGNALLWGAGRVIMTERPGWQCQLFDVDAWSGAALERVVGDASNETEIAFRLEARYVCRLAERPSSPAGAANRRVRPARASFRLQPVPTRQIDRVFLQQEASRPPAPGEVEISVKAAALNFRDIMKAVGAYPAGSAADTLLGDECAGVVSRTGMGAAVAVGDEVIALTPGSMGSFVTCASTAVYPKPANISFEDASGLLVAGITAWYALARLAQVQAGEKVFLPSAAGGVGLAALQIARLRGATVLASAGSESKRDFLRSLGIDHVFDSRRLDFARQVLDATSGAGVDVVLNSIAGDALTRSVELLAPFGRFVEIGKVDIYRNTSLGMRMLKDNISFHVVDLVQLFSGKLDLTRRLALDVLQLVQEGALKPLHTQTFCISKAAEAFRCVSESRHMGKVVLTVPDSPVLVRRSAERPLKRILSRATYVITGGTRGFGFETAAWLAAQGARHLALIGRTGEVGNDIGSRIQEIRDRGVTVRMIGCDIANLDECRTALNSIRASSPPIRGVFHAAAVIRDALIDNFDEISAAAVLGPKVLGAWNLHQLTREDRLDFFVCYSSISALVGNAGQAVYAAANAWLNAFAGFRRQGGLPALAVSLGALADTGFAARDEAVSRRLEQMGLTGMSTRATLSALALLIERGQVNGIAADIDWQQLNQASPFLCQRPKFMDLHRAYILDHVAAATFFEQLALLAPAQRRAAAVRRLQSIVAEVLHANPESIGPAIPLADLGLDSLAALEFQHRVSHEFQLQVTVGEMSNATLGTLADLLLRKYEELAAAQPAAAPEPHPVHQSGAAK